MQRRTIMISAASSLALAGCLGRPAIVGIGDDDGGGSGSADDGEASQSDTGMSDGDADSADDGLDDGGDTGPEPACADIDAFGETIQITLTASQYDATVRDLTGAAGSFAAGVEDDVHLGTIGLGMDLEAAAALAPQVAAAVDLAALLPCDPATTDIDERLQCFDAFVPAFARLAWRRPLTTGDVDALQDVFVDGDDVEAGMRAVIATVLAADDFLVVSHTGTPTAGDPTLVVLDAHALATRLAMFLWNSGPDEELLALADSGELLEPAVLREQAERLLGDVRAARMVDDFHTQWLELDELAKRSKDPEIFPEWDAELGADMIRGTLAFARSIVLGGSGTLRDLFTTPSSFANARLAAIYGDDIVGPAPSGPTFEPVMLDPARRGGLLGEPSFATTHSRFDQIGFSRRGQQIRESLLCTPVPPPPSDIDMELAPPPAEAPHKDVWAATFAAEVCIGCHAFMDPISFGLDNYDAIGRWTEEIDGFPVEASGELDGTTFMDRPELVELLLVHERFPSCVVEQYARYALDRTLDDDDECTRASLVEALEESDGNIRVLALAIVDSDAFRVVRTGS